MTTRISKAEDPMGVAQFVLSPSLAKSQTYRVTWSIDIDAKSARGAARLALEIQQDKESIANVFEVREPSGNNVTIDLNTPRPQIKLSEIADIIVNHYGTEDEPFTKTNLRQILDAIVEVLDAK